MARFLKWIVNIILLCAILVAAALLIPPLSGITTVMIDDIEIETNLEQGSVTYAKEVALNEIGVGDKILIASGNSDYVYRVKNLDTGDGACVLEDTTGTTAETVKETLKDSVPKVLLTVPYIGYIPMAMKSTEGLIIIALVVVFVIILFILSELWRPDLEEQEEKDSRKKQKKAEKRNKDVKKTEDPEIPVVSMDKPSQILEEVSGTIASEVSSVVAEGSVESAEPEVDEPTRSMDLSDEMKKMEKMLWEEANENDDPNGETKIFPGLEETPAAPEVSQDEDVTFEDYSKLL